MASKKKSTTSELKELRKKVKELQQENEKLKLENMTLQAKVNLYEGLPKTVCDTVGGGIQWGIQVLSGGQPQNDKNKV